MPYKLTEEEKEALRQQYRANIETINSYIPEEYADHRLKIDMNAFNKKINDPKQAWLYKKALEIKAREVKKKEIQEALGQELAHLKDPNKAYELNRVMHTELIASDDPEAMAYNREVMRQYFLHPEAMLQRRFQKVLNADFSEVSKFSQCKDIDSLMLLYTEKEPTLVEDSCSMTACFDNAKIKALLTPEMREYYSSVARNTENIIDASNFMKKVNEGYFTVPHSITDAQDNILMGTSLATDHPELGDKLRENMANVAGDTLVKQFHDFFKELPKHDIDIKQPGALSKYVVLPNDGGANKPISVSTWINNNMRTGNPVLVELPANTVSGIKKIFAEDWTQKDGFKFPDFPEKFKEPAWKVARNDMIFKYAIELDVPVHELDNGGLSTIAKAFPGNFKERFFGTTSLQYKNLTKAMADFDNPNHVGYHNSMPVKIAANQYLMHKGITTREQAMNLPSPAKERSILCFDLIESFQKNEGPEVAKIVPGRQQMVEPQMRVERIQAIQDAREVEENDVMNQSDDEVEVEELNVSMDDANLTN